MRDYRLRTDIQRESIDGFSLPMGIRPIDLKPPMQGYTLTYTQGEDEVPDSYAFHIVISHDRLKPVILKAFDLLPETVSGIIEIGSRDAYRATDVYLGEETLPRKDFQEVWEAFELFLLEDCSIGAGANSEEPFIEVFLDQWKGLSIHVQLERREEVERLLQSVGLEEVPQTWSHEEGEPEAGASEIRPVLELEDEFSPDVDELLLQLRHAWQLSLDIDPERNEDEGGRDLGLTLWHAVIIAESTQDPNTGAYISIWVTASSANEVVELIEVAMEEQSDWDVTDLYSMDRIAFDDRPEALSNLPPRPTEKKVHLVEVEPWKSSAPIADA